MVAFFILHYTTAELPNYHAFFARTCSTSSYISTYNYTYFFFHLQVLNIIQSMMRSLSRFISDTSEASRISFIRFVSKNVKSKMCVCSVGSKREREPRRNRKRRKRGPVRSGMRRYYGQADKKKNRKVSVNSA